jgi:glycine/D-amino acid oxidase-like deaminating enzyme
MWSRAELRLDAPAGGPARHRSLWMEQALADEAGAAAAAAPLDGERRADVCVVGGGYVGLWTALRVRELAPEARVVVLEADLCGSGASGANGGFALSWWPKIATLIARCGGDEDEAYRLARASAAAVGELAAFCELHGIDAELHRGGWLWTATASAQLGAWHQALRLSRARGDDPFAELTREELAERTGSRVHLGGVYEAGAATVQPARLARGLRAVALQAGVEIYERSPVVAIDAARGVVRTAAPAGVGAGGRAAGAGGRAAGAGGRAAGAGGRAAGAGGRAAGAGGRAAGAGGRAFGAGGRAAGARGGAAGGSVEAGAIVLATNAWAAGLAPLRGTLAVVSSDVVATAPMPDALAASGWSGGEAISDSHLRVDYWRTTGDARVVLGKGGGALAYGGRVGTRFDRPDGRAREVAAQLARLVPAAAGVPLAAAWGGAVDRSLDGLPFFGVLGGDERAADGRGGRPDRGRAAGARGSGAPGGGPPRVVYGLGFSGNGVAPALLAGRILASLALGREDEWSRCGLAGGPPGRFPPEPIRFLGGQLVRRAVARKERREDAERPVGRLTRALAALAPPGFARGTR